MRISKIYRFEQDRKIPIDSAFTGEIVAVAGMEDVTVGVTFTDPESPRPLPLIDIDPPTISMDFIPNDSPFAGREGKYVPIAEAVRGFHEILDGKHDDLPEQAFYMVGTIEEAVEAARKMKEE